MKTILIQTLFAAAAALFWMATLPIAIIALGVVALWDRISASLPANFVRPQGTGMAPVTA